ncbi:hypothetical protein CAOG_06421 [Capsaspora owczarzaki ATCC 30864]|uniref:ABC transporter domain-containing protein n=1 Tax=Capsaspora owczarzaki (strain ATCC 30864) TaxID=595528 RepID=A0A0D2VWT6_CAPO3|nr:hypothetical protein CAOG_06421 [Capsaspora owczarzaki ATCC 30864]KJE96047.1 hypothetical protein CAOG_006421 [Capsaspora owczarzaki ATCC 30864]|eukprot:XP_004345170.1 hypothetical protein CAOG_06421 [Capsaspora owczarzaki ATCC 30864]
MAADRSDSSVAILVTDMDSDPQLSFNDNAAAAAMLRVQQERANGADEFRRSFELATRPTPGEELVIPFQPDDDDDDDDEEEDDSEANKPANAAGSGNGAATNHLQLGHLGVREEIRKSSANPFALSWNRLTYSVTEVRKKEKIVKEILKEQTGAVMPGQMIAIMGTSGAGKTTLLNVLAGRNITGQIGGFIALNGHARNKSFRRQSAYVEQDDLMFPNLTTKETITFAALLRMPSKYTTQDKIQRAMDLIRQLGLSQCVNTRIGGPERKGVSGGERKRIAIAVELITNPKLLFLDEPTSGLDAFTAFHVMETVRAVAKGGRAVVCTIHQPRYNIYALFDKLLLLSQGAPVFYGPALDAVSYFSKLGYECPPLTNCSDFFLDIVTVDTRNTEAEEASRERVAFFHQQYAKSNLAIEATAEVDKLLGGSKSHRVDAVEESHKHTQWNLPWLMEFFVLYRRATMNFLREKRVTIAALVQSLIMAFLGGFVFFQMGHDQNAIQNRQGALFFVLINQAFGGMLGVVMMFQSEKSVFLRERSSGAYRVSAYFLAKSLAELPVQMAIPVIYATIIYWLMGLNSSAAAFFTFVANVVAVIICAQSLGLVVSAAAPSLAVANAIAPIITIAFLLFSGLYINLDDLWAGFTYTFQKLSFLYWGYQSLLLNEFTDSTFTCNPNISYRCLDTGDKILTTLGVGSTSVWENFGILILLTVVYRFFAYLALRFLKKPKLKLA